MSWVLWEWWLCDWEMEEGDDAMLLLSSASASASAAAVAVAVAVAAWT